MPSRAHFWPGFKSFQAPILCISYAIYYAIYYAQAPSDSKMKALQPSSSPEDGASCHDGQDGQEESFPLFLSGVQASAPQSPMASTNEQDLNI